MEFVLVGHSERRQLFHESDEDVNRKLLAALRSGLKPVLCVGETLPEREAGHILDKVQGQLDKGLAGVRGADWDQVTVAYEPVWAIGTGRNATPQQAEEVHRHLRPCSRQKPRRGASRSSTAVRSSPKTAWSSFPRRIFPECWSAAPP